MMSQTTSYSKILILTHHNFFLFIYRKTHFTVS